jgi:hypothetical protein
MHNNRVVFTLHDELHTLYIPLAKQPVTSCTAVTCTPCIVAKDRGRVGVRTTRTIMVDEINNLPVIGTGMRRPLESTCIICNNPKGARPNRSRVGRYICTFLSYISFDRAPHLLTIHSLVYIHLLIDNFFLHFSFGQTFGCLCDSL